MSASVFYKLRTTLTTLNLGYVERSALSEFGNLAEFISNFKHLENTRLIGQNYLEVVSPSIN